MKRSTFKITKLDCLAEEQIIRMKLEPLSQVKHLDFDIPARKLEVFHLEDVQPIQKAISELDLNDHLVSTYEAELHLEDDASQQRKILWWVLGINFGFFVIEMIYGWLSNSMGLVADSLDMLADALVYALSLFAVGAALSRKKKVATISGYFQITLAIIGVLEVTRRFLGYGEVPVFQTMIAISFLALIANVTSLILLQKVKGDEAHMKASWIFTSNDIIINIGVIIAGVMVFLTQSKIPDLITGLIVFVIVLRGAIRILKLN